MRRIYLLICLLIVFIPRAILAQSAPKNDAAPSPGEGGTTQEYAVVHPVTQAFKMAVPDFQGQGTADIAPKDLAQLLRQDLDLSGDVTVIDPKAYFNVAAPLQAAGTDFGPWSTIGAQGVITGIVSQAGTGSVQLELRFFNVGTATLALGKRYTGDKSTIRRMVHRFVDELLQTITGKRGGFDSVMAFSSERTGRREIYVSESDGSNVQQLTRNQTMNLSPSWSPNGKSLVYTSYKSGNPDLFLMDLSGKEVALSNSPGANLAGEFSKDGSRIAFSKVTSGANMDIYIVSPGGGEAKRITTDPGLDISPTWSPNGSLIAFVSDRSGAPQVYILDGPESASNKPVRVSAGSYCTSPAFSPDGRYIAYTGRRGGFDIFVIDLQGEGGRTVSAVTDFPGDEEDPTWSPDSRIVAYSGSQNGGFGIYLKNIYGGKPVRISDTKANDKSPAWGPVHGE